MDPVDISSDTYTPSYDPSILTGRETQPQQPPAQAEEPIKEQKQPPRRQRQVAPKETKTVAAAPAQKAAPTDYGRWKLFAGIFLIILAVYLLIASLSYFANGADDQSIVQGHSYSQIAAQSERIGNSGGPVGAFVAHLMLSRWLGVGSFILIFYAAAIGLTLIKVKKFRFWHLTYKCLLSAITLSVLAGFVTYAMTSFNYWGGEHGHMVNKFLMDNTGIWGAVAVNMLLVAAVVLVFLREIQAAWNLYRERIERHRAKLARERAEAEARRRQMEQMLATPAQTSETPQASEPQPDMINDVNDSHTTAGEPLPNNHRRGPEPFSSGYPVTDYDPAESPTAPYYPSASEPAEAPHTPASEATTHAPASAERSTYAPEPEAGAYKHEAEDFPAHTSPAAEIQPKPQSSPEELPVGKPESYTAYQPATPATQATTAENLPDFAEETEAEVTMTISAGSVEEAAHINDKPYDPTATLSRFRLPSIDLLQAVDTSMTHVDIDEQEENKARLTKTLETFGVKLSKIEATIGPTITRYEIIPAEGVRTRSVRSLGDDLALSLSALGIRIIAPIPGKGTIGIEVPNKKPQIVGIRSILSSEAYQKSTAELPIAMGSTITNEVYVADLAKLPHLLVAGATGTGKSVGLNTIITSLLYKKHPAELKFVFIDPKRVELTPYRKLNRHYLAALPGEDPVITDTSKVVTVLNSLCVEMGNRLNLLEEAGVRNIKEYNEKFISRRLNPNKHRFLPYIVLVIDEFADIILTAGKEVESPVSRLAAVARAAGIHLIIATQRPTVNVITGGIKTNIPGRIAFRVNQAVDSKTILDTTGANLLAGKGDMLFSQNGVIERVQCAFIDTPEVQAICDSISDQIGYDEPYELPEYVAAGSEGPQSKPGNLNDRDPLFPEAARMVVEAGRASTTDLQRRLSVGFGRAGRIMDQLETAGVVGPQQGARPRQVLMDFMALEQYLTPPATD